MTLFEWERPAPRAYFQMRSDDGLNPTAAVLNRAEHGGLTLYGMKGTAVSDGDPMVWIAFDVPQQLRSERSKPQQELDDLRDFVRQTLGRTDFELEPGPDSNLPPDASLVTDAGTVALEATQIHLPAAGRGRDTVSRSAAFEQVRGELIRRSPVLAGALRRHAGHMVYVWFTASDDVADGFSLPSRTDRGDALVDLLLSTGPSWQTGLTPQQAPPDAVAWSEDGQIGVTWGGLPHDYRSAFSVALGFELAMVYGVKVKRTDTRKELLRIVEQHDSASSEVLVVTTDATLRSGLYFPSSRVVAGLLFEDPDPLEGWEPTRLRAIALHHPAGDFPVRWLKGDLFAA